MVTIQVPDGTYIAPIGDIHAHSEQFDNILKSLKPSDKLWIVSLGDVYDKGFGDKVSEEITDKLQDLEKKHCAFAIKGNHELKHLRYSRKNPHTYTAQLAWWESRPLSLTFEFANKTKLTVVHGGVSTHHTWQNLNTDLDVCYIRQLDEKNKSIPLVKKEKGWELERPGVLWHDKYDGRFGYIASGHQAQFDGVPKFYNHSCNLDTGIFKTGILTAMVYGAEGKQDLIMMSGKAAGPIIDSP